MDRLRTEPISADELQQAKNQFARDYILGRESNKDKAMTLGHAVVIHNDIKTADGEFDIFMNTTATDVQRVAQTYFRPENRLVLTIMPRGAGPEADDEPPIEVLAFAMLALIAAARNARLRCRTGRRSGRRGRFPRAKSSSLRMPCARWRTACR